MLRRAPRLESVDGLMLDTLPRMEGARGLYECLGFVRRPAYYDTRLPEAVFMEMALRTRWPADFFNRRH
jgi:hypothetical protein